MLTARWQASSAIPGYPAGGRRNAEDFRLPGQTGRSVYHRRRTGGAHPHRRSHRPFCGYVDFIAWDIQTALQMAKKFFEDSDIPWASFHTFRREAGTVNLKTPPEEEPDDEDQVP